MSAIAATAIFAGAALAQSTEPALATLERDVRALYQSAQQHIVRVNVPVHLSTKLLDQEHPLVKWGRQLDPAILQKLAEAARQKGGGVRVYLESPRPATPPTTAQGGAQTVSSTSTTQAITPPGIGEATRLPLPPDVATINVEFIGLVLDVHGDVLVPLFIDPAYQDGPLQVTVDDTTVTTAQLIAADRLTALSVVQLNQPAGQPVTFAADKPPAGSLVLMLAPTRRSVRLGVWAGTADENALLVDPRGNFSAIVRNGHALFPATFVPVVQQLITTGMVKRAQLGVFIREVGTDDPIRAKLSNLGSRPAAFVQEVIAGSAAERAGLAAGDLILRVNDDPVEDVVTFAAAIANCRGKTQVQILRDGELQVIAVDLQPQ